MDMPQRLIALRSLVPPLLVIGLISNLAVLVSPLFMMQVLDRVVPSGNMATLALLLIAAAAFLLGAAALEAVRDRALAGAGAWVEEVVEADGILTPEAREARSDAAALKSFLAQGGANAAVGGLFLPLFLLALFVIHPVFALAGGAGAAAVGGLALLQRRLPAFWEASADQAAARAEATSRILAAQPALARTMHLGRNLGRRIAAARAEMRAALAHSATIRARLTAATGLARGLAQLGTLSLGAWLVIGSEISAGGMIGASLLAARSIASVEGLVRAWPAIVSAREAWRRRLAATPRSAAVQTEVADLSGRIVADNLVVPRGPGAPPRLDRVSFELPAGACLAILGESGSGKTTLLEALAGISPAPIGAVRYDETDIRTLPETELGDIIGYLPQRADLVGGTIAENICAFEEGAEDSAIIDAASLAGVHGLISSLPRAYETDLSTERHLLSAGQMQRVALARAVFRRPRFLFLDEPNALLDALGERQLAAALERLKRRGTTIVMVVHRAGILGLADFVLTLERGRVADFGPRAEVLGRLAGRAREIRLPVSEAALQDLTDWVARQFTRASDAAFANKACLVAAELFNFARANGPSSSRRLLTFSFAFENDHACTITLTEPRRARLERKIEKVRTQLAEPGPATLAEDEMALALVLQTAAEFDHRSEPKLTCTRVRLTDAPLGSAEAVH